MQLLEMQYPDYLTWQEWRKNVVKYSYCEHFCKIRLKIHVTKRLFKYVPRCISAIFVKKESLWQNKPEQLLPNKVIRIRIETETPKTVKSLRFLIVCPCVSYNYQKIFYRKFQSIQICCCQQIFWLVVALLPFIYLSANFDNEIKLIL